MRSNNLYNTLPKERLISHGCNQWPKSSNWCFVIEEGRMKSELGTLMNIISLRGGAALYNECVHATRSLGGNFPKQNSKFLLIVFFHWCHLLSIDMIYPLLHQTLIFSLATKAIASIGLFCQKNNFRISWKTFGKKI